MTGDVSDMLARLKMVLPARWFASETPVLDALLTGLASAWSGLYGLLGFVRAQARIATASGIFLDMAASDFAGAALPRRSGESDAAYSARVRASLLLPRATRSGLIETLTALTGRTPAVFEPRNAADTGGYNLRSGYNSLGGYGSMSLPYQFFVTALRPNDTAISNASGYGAGPGGYNLAPLQYASDSALGGIVSDAEIYAAVAAVLPSCAIAWTRISD